MQTHVSIYEVEIQSCGGFVCVCVCVCVYAWRELGGNPSSFMKHVQQKHIMLFSWFLNEPSGYLLARTPVFMRFIFFADIAYIAHWGKNL